ncbi:hypothetical protein QVA73_08055 [Staphylococcus chromogenes]|uniref:hypothetical protein n=1 Tax=Staphylococcus chromogenes TaxID=46126 RepID=UPI002900B573|nr:hypothetical protein [Staphylococcus chromogenes]MDU0476846.1 hypothetical protein [Staphylococcus chromogenes]
MVKIKRKVELEPKAFLKHVLEKEETEVELDGYAFDGSNYLFGPEVTVNEYVSYNPYKNTYTVEVEEEIAEDTKVPKLIEVYEYDGRLSAYLNTKMPIKKALNDSQSDLLCVPIAFYMLNDDYTMTLLWKEGKMVE